MSDLVEFLKARLDEDEAAAGAARNWTDRDWTTSLDQRGDGWVSADGADPIVMTIGHSDAQASAIVEHIARWDPARIRAEVAAKRRVLELYEELGDPSLYVVMQHLAQAYADHADYDQKWSPS
jgi:hypothetical protein